jgi:hypothetical protein
LVSGTLLEPVDAGTGGELPELVRVHWRPRVDERRLTRTGRLWTASTAAHTVPFIVAAVVLGVLAPILVPVSLILLAHAWAIPELYAARGARALRAGTRAGTGVGNGRGQSGADSGGSQGDSTQAERVAAGLLGDLLDHRPRELYARTGVVLERGRLGTWLLGDAGALLVRPGGRRVNCYCVKATDGSLPRSDRIAHLLLALRSDEIGFATLANLSFSGARWRVRRRLSPLGRDALDAAGRRRR